MTKVDLITWILTAISFIGAIYNIGKKTIGFVIWAIADIIFVGMYIYLKQYANAVLFLMYVGVNLWGIYQWNRSKK